MDVIRPRLRPTIRGSTCRCWRIAKMAKGPRLACGSRSPMWDRLWLKILVVELRKVKVSYAPSSNGWKLEDVQDDPRDRSVSGGIHPAGGGSNACRYRDRA